MRAIILAGGKGTRLKPYTVSLPKPLVPIGDELPIIEVLIKQLARTGFTHITIAVNHLANLIMAFCADGSRWGVKINYSIESKNLSTIAPLALIPDLPENFLVLNGDLFCNLDFAVFYQYHLDRGNDVTVATRRRSVQIDFGTLQYDDGNRIVQFSEKPIHEFDVSMGVYCLNRRVVSHLDPEIPYGFDNLMIDGIRSARKIEAYPFNGYWLDIGRPDDYEQANLDYPHLSKEWGLQAEKEY